MIKKVLVFLLMYTALPVFAGVYENALNGNNYVLLYIYTGYCRTCKLIEPYFDNVVQSHGDIQGVKVSAETPYGRGLMYKFNGKHVPYIVLSSPKGRTAVNVEIGCLVDDVCIERVLKGLRTK